MQRIIDVFEASTAQFSSFHDMAERLSVVYGYSVDQFGYETPNDEYGEPDETRMRIVVYEAVQV